MSNLVSRLEHDQRIVVSLRPNGTLEAFKAAVARGVVHVRFVETRGGTELGVRLDQAACALDDLQTGRGAVRLEGSLVLDSQLVRFRGTVRLESLDGTGTLVRAEPDQREPEPAPLLE